MLCIYSVAAGYMVLYTNFVVSRVKHVQSVLPYPKKLLYIYIMLNRNFVRRNITSISIIIFIALYGFVIAMKPAFLYNKDGSLREFGVGFRRKTVIPAWLLAIALAIISYFGVMYYLAAPKLVF